VGVASSSSPPPQTLKRPLLHRGSLKAYKLLLESLDDFEEDEDYEEEEIS